MKAPYLMLNLARGERGVAPIGEALRGAREGLGLTVEQAAVDTRISARFLEALEMERFEDLPADVYVRGFIRSYAAYLRLDPIPLLATFEYAGDSPAPPIGAPFGGHGRSSPQRAAPEPLAPPPPAGRRERGPGVVPAQDAGLFDLPKGDPWRGGGSFDGGGRGVLGPRGRRAGAGLAGMIALIGAGVVALGVIVIGLVVLLSGGDGGNEPVGAVPTATPSTAATEPVTVIVVGTATPTPGAGASETPATPLSETTPTRTPTLEPATATAVPAQPTSPPPPPPTATPPPTPTVTPTPGAGASETPATPLSETTPTRTPTLEPATATAVPAQPTSPPPPPPTATPTPTPTVTPTPVPPGQTDECDRSGATVDCGPAPYFVVCYGPGAFFFDVNGDYPLQPGWDRRGPFTTQGAALNAGLACT